MAATLKNVYCYQVGSDDCYKIGRTKNDPDTRKNGFSTGSPSRFTRRRTEKTPHPTKLENYVHALLSTRRAENGEFFFVTREEAEAAIDEGVAFVERTHETVEKASKLRKRRPSGAMLNATEAILALYRDLQSKRRAYYLLEREIEFLESRIQLAIGDSAGIEGVATWKWQDRWNVDLTRFEQEEPKEYAALFEKYKRNSGTRYFRLTKGILTEAIAADNPC